jgi:mono/diheme cytochrome c family protein
MKRTIAVVGCAVLLASTSARPQSAPQAPAATPAGAEGRAGNAEDGRTLYTKYGCYECHGREGQGGVAPRLALTAMPLSGFVRYSRAPRNQMPPYTAKVVSDQELTDIYAFVRSRPRPPAIEAIFGRGQF